MKQRVLIVSHADADGHLIAEQTRRNLDLIPSFEVMTVVDPERTRDHKVWTRLSAIKEIDDADIVFFVDLMFAPTTFAAEANALVDFVRERPDKKFFLIDHHPLPLRRLDPAANLRAIYRPDVFECAIGPRSGMMVIAALCEKQGSLVADIKQPSDDVLALGMRRAAALGGPLPGAKLLALLRSGYWHGLAELGRDEPAYHRLPRGRRPSSQPHSDTLAALDEAATTLLAYAEAASHASMQSHPGRGAMAYDFEAVQDLDVSQQRIRHDAGRRIRLKNSRVNPRDLEAIVTLLEVAALSLTTEPDATFTLEQLIREARDLGGDEISIEERDVRIVLEKANFLEKVAGEFRLR